VGGQHFCYRTDRGDHEMRVPLNKSDPANPATTLLLAIEHPRRRVADLGLGGSTRQHIHETTSHRHSNTSQSFIE
jgi:hypothetical protein